MNNKIIFILLCVFFSCAEKHFLYFSIDGNQIDSNNIDDGNMHYTISDFKIYFNRIDIESEYIEINFIATDNYYYGNFFFDEIFMDILKKKSKALNADALIYEKDRIDFPNYNKNYLYFTAIQYQN